MKSRDVLSPDISFVSGDRLAGLVEAPEGFYEGAPDLAIEFLSPRESMKRLNRKLAQYFENGTRLAWVMDAKRRVVAVHSDVEHPRELTEVDELSGEEIVRGFRIPVRDIFAGLRQ
jgi:Uma2 family endonuclease